MVKFIQEWVTQLPILYAIRNIIFHNSQTYIHSLKLYVYPTQSQRFGFDIRFYQEFAYQKVRAGFDNSSIRAIIRDEYFLNGHQRRP
jgi:hypothetical protein